MDMDLDKIDKRLERIEAKLDNHLERVVRAEESISGMRGQIRIIVSLCVAAVSAIAAAFFNNFLGGK